MSLVTLPPWIVSAPVAPETAPILRAPVVSQLPDVIVADPALPAVEPKIASALVTLPPLTRRIPFPADVPTVRSALTWLIAPPLVTSSVPPPMLVPPL